jgi:hypothetical protein
MSIPATIAVKAILDKIGIEQLDDGKQFEFDEPLCSLIVSKIGMLPKTTGGSVVPATILSRAIKVMYDGKLKSKQVRRGGGTQVRVYNIEVDSRFVDLAGRSSYYTDLKLESIDDVKERMMIIVEPEVEPVPAVPKYLKSKKRGSVVGNNILLPAAPKPKKKQKRKQDEVAPSKEALIATNKVRKVAGFDQELFQTKLK